VGSNGRRLLTAPKQILMSLFIAAITTSLPLLPLAHLVRQA